MLVLVGLRWRKEGFAVGFEDIWEEQSRDCKLVLRLYLSQ
jgi:hypothetical protein